MTDDVKPDPAAKERVQGWLNDPKHQRPPGHEDDTSTQDDDLTDPKHNQEDDIK